MSTLQGTLEPLLRIRRLSVRALLALGLLIATDALIIFDIVVWGGQRFRPPPVSFIGGQAIFIGEMFFAPGVRADGLHHRDAGATQPVGLAVRGDGPGHGRTDVGHLPRAAEPPGFRPMDTLLLAGAWLVSTVHLPSLVVCFAFV